ncbi:2-keto-4-pentenoate hydratase/2-oxohepta-3-ene-1,7-dioic acid hydratase [Synechococcus sp. PCC 7502]|uniref:fumarylacetoacetate hydrolase family protein n=1 Tax=Synechococcus sp. PCC 7502 TaxID=1173263 RepID=UPI00029FF76E|nr:fumarylacetoacetate hydrolase family protein [Synechococcus sp. PCC 7502]AFY73601.1 2-keto-4-pentenoate hydratase/2-oxohepta-3-ene-1,7-dioic acid hydratase [Synechococcus sp. PCC 7502]
MADRYVRVKTASHERVFYGILQLNQSVQILSAAPWLGGKPTNDLIAPDGYELLAPCEPSKIVAVGKNYVAHAAEMNSPVPTEPLIFLKPSSAILAPEGKILLPSQSKQIDYEGELALVIGSYCTNCSLDQASSAIWGYTIANDVTARDLQRQDNQWTRAKGFDTFCPLGPWIVREISPTAQIQTFLQSSKQPLQADTIDNMVFSPEFLVAYISQIMTLLPGDIILTGTPQGVGALQVGDRIAIEIEGIGKLQNYVDLRSPLANLEEDES